MNCTETVRAILREYPETRDNSTRAYLIYLDRFSSNLNYHSIPLITHFGSINQDSVIRISTFLKLWQRHRKSFS